MRIENWELRIGQSGDSHCGSLPQFFDLHIEVCGIDYTFSLELHPDAVAVCAGEDHIELNLRAAVGDEWMLVHHIDQVIACGEHVSPGAEIFLQAVTGFHTEQH